MALGELPVAICAPNTLTMVLFAAIICFTRAWMFSFNMF